MASTEKKVSVVFTVKNDEFNRNLNETKQQINLTAKELQTASAKMNLYGSNVATLGEKQGLLKTQISQVSDKLNQYKTNIETTTTKLNSNKQALEQLANKKKELTAEYNQAIKTYGAESTEVQQLKEKLASCKSEYDEMNNKVKSNVSSLNSSQRQMAQSETELLKYQTQLKETNKALIENSSGFMQASKKFSDTSESLKKAGGSISDVGGNLMKLSAPFAVIAGAGVMSAVSFEDAFAGVKKTVDGTPEQLENIRQGILKLSEDMPESAEQISAVGESAGQLGIKTENVLDFTKTMVMMGDSTNLSSEEASTALARLANITQMPQENFQRLGSSIVELGNNMATTESDITEMSLRLAGAGHQVGMNEAQIVGLSAGLSSVGIEAEAGGSAFSKLMVQMQLASETGSKANDVIAKTGYSLRDLEMMQDKSAKKFKALAEGMGMTSEELKKMVDSSSSLESFSKVTGKSAKDFSDSFKKDATGSILEFIKGLQNCEKNGISAISVLDGMGITEVRMRDALLRASGAGDKFAQSINLSTNAWDKNVALTNEAEKRYETTKSKIEICKNKLKEFGIEIGDKLLPHVTSMIDGLENLVKWFGSLSEGTQQFILKAGLLTFATGGLLKVTGSLIKSYGEIKGAIGGALGFIGKLTTATETATVAGEAMAGGATASAGAFSVFSGVILPATLAIGAVAGTMYAVHEANDVMKTGISTTTDKMSLMERVMASLMGVQRYSKEELQNMGLEYKDWNSNVSPKTASTLDELAEKFRNLQIDISRVNAKDAITDQDKAELVQKADDLCTDIIKKIQEKQKESNSAVAKLFNMDGVMDDTEKGIMAGMDKTGTEATQKIQDIQKQIDDLINSGAIKTAEGQQKYNDLMKQAQDTTLQNVVDHQEEIESATEGFNERINSLDLDGTKKLLQEKAKIRDDEKNKIHESYDQSIADLQVYLKNADEVEKPKVQERLNRAIDERDKAIKAEDDKWQGYINVVNEKAPEVLEHINKYNGQELSAEDLQGQAILNKLKDRYENLNQITETGTYMMKDKITGGYQQVSVVVDEKTGEITGAYSHMTGEIGTYSEDIKGSLTDVSRSAVGNTSTMNSAFDDMAKTTINDKGQIVNAHGEIVGSLNSIKDTGEGTREGIINLNGTPIKIQCDNNGAITNINEVKQGIDDVKEKDGTSITIWAKIKSSVEGFIGSSGLGSMPGLMGEATGTSNAPEGIYNVNERGQELFDSISGSPSFMLRNSLMSTGYDTAYLSSSTKVSNSLMTTAKMNRSIAEGIQNNTVVAIDKLASSLGNELANALKGTNTEESTGNNIEVHVHLDNRELTNILSESVGNKLASSRRKVR